MAITKPAVLPPWAESGDIVQPTNAEIQVGWPVGATPPSRQRFNWILNYGMNGVRYLTRRGIPDWDADDTYMIGDRVIGDDGKTYRSLVDNNTGQTPSSSPTKWERWGFTFNEFLAGVTTPPQFDNDNSLATTAFVQRALGNRQGYNVPETGSSFSAADAGKVFGLNGPSTYTLPSASGLPNGATFDFFAAGNGCVVQASGSDTITTKGGTTVTSLTLNSGDTLSLVRVGPTAWLAISGSSQLEFADVFGASLTENGYQKLPGGLIIQWGSLSVTNGQTITFPVALTSNVRVVITPGFGAGLTQVFYSIQGEAPWTGFKINHSSGVSVVFNWLAFGY